MVGCTMRKDTCVDADGNLIPEGQDAGVPAAAIKAMVRYHGQSDDGSLVAAARALLIEFGVFGETAPAVAPKVETIDLDTGECRITPGRAARYVCLKPHLFRWSPQVQVDQRERYGAAAGKGDGRVMSEADKRLAEQVAADYQLDGRGAADHFFLLNNNGYKGTLVTYDDDDYGWTIVGEDGRTYFQPFSADLSAQ